MNLSWKEEKILTIRASEERLDKVLVENRIDAEDGTPESPVRRIGIVLGDQTFVAQDQAPARKVRRDELQGVRDQRDGRASYRNKTKRKTHKPSATGR